MTNGVGRQPGALVTGADYRGLGVVRSLGRKGIPVWVLRDPEHPLAAASRYTRRSLEWPQGGDATKVAFLADLADRRGLTGWVLIPTTDEVVSMVAHHHDLLAKRFQLTTPPWDRVEWACDKRCLNELADEAGVAHPWTAYPQTTEEVASLDPPFPVIVKPAVRESLNRLTSDKAWRADDRRSLLALHAEATTLLPPQHVMVQELIPGNGESQYSFAALCRDGLPLASVVARRVRQYPAEFGRFSTFVESVDEPDVAAVAERLLTKADYTGIVEIEFKRDARDGQLKVLDANPRVWGWHTLSQREGPDFSYLLWRMARGESVSGGRARAGQQWMRMDVDLAVAAREILGGRLSLRQYLGAFAVGVESAIFAADDLLPGAVELGLVEYMAISQGFARIWSA